MLETLKYIVSLMKEAGIPTALIIFVGAFIYVSLKYLEAKYGVTTILTPKQSEAQHPQEVTVNVGAEDHLLNDRRTFITPAICKSYRKETDTQLKEIRATLDEIKGSTSVIEKLVLKSAGGG